VSTPLPPDAPVVVTMAWSKVVAGDVVLDPWGEQWRVTAAATRVTLVRMRDGQQLTRPRSPDQTVDVLVPAIERDSVALIRGAFASARVLPERKVG